MPGKTTSTKKRNVSGPSEIAPGVFVGGWKDAEAFSGPTFCVLDEPAAEIPASVHIQIFDESTNKADRKALDRLAKEVTGARRSGKPVLIFCGRGMMRSPLGGMWYLRESEGLTLDAAYERVHSRRPQTVHPSKWVENVGDLLEK